MSKGLRICIDARLAPGESGGVEQVVIGLADGFSRLTEGQEEYLFLSYSDDDAWIRPYIGGSCQLLSAGAVLARQSGGRSSNLF